MCSVALCRIQEYCVFSGFMWDTGILCVQWLYVGYRNTVCLVALCRIHEYCVFSGCMRDTGILCV